MPKGHPLPFRLLSACFGKPGASATQPPKRKGRDSSQPSVRHFFCISGTWLRHERVNLGSSVMCGRKPRSGGVVSLVSRLLRVSRPSLMLIARASTLASLSRGCMVVPGVKVIPRLSPGYQILKIMDNACSANVLQCTVQSRPAGYCRQQA